MSRTSMPSDLPPGWRLRYGKYRYQVPAAHRHLWDGKSEFTLGTTLSEAYRTWFERIGDDERDDIVTVNQLFDAWWTEYVLVHLSESTQDSYAYYLVPLRRVFGEMRPHAIKASDAYRYRSKRAQKARVAANREVSVLSSALTFAVEKGWIEHNPLRGQISRKGAAAEKPRYRIPTFEELDQFCEINPHLSGWVLLKRLTGLRQGEMLAINLDEHWDGKVLSPPASKGGKSTEYVGEALERAISTILNGRVPHGPLFTTRHGTRMSASGLRSKWQRAMRKFEKCGGEKFNEHDIRKTVANAAESLEEARRLLRHQEAKTTARIYRIGTERVSVLEEAHNPE